MALKLLKFNFAAPHGEPAKQRETRLTAMEMARWGDSSGVAAVVSVNQHHVTGHGWSCDPDMAAALFLPNTTNLILSIECASAREQRTGTAADGRMRGI